MASGTESATETSYWIRFFTDSGIPAGDATHYAVLFTDNRIQKGMLTDLTKEYLNDMGVTRLGDIIAILKHAKVVHDQDAKEKALKGAKMNISVLSSNSPSSRRSTAASRMIDHFLAKEPDAAPMNQPPAPRLSLDSNAAKKSSVFDRLGADSTGLNVSPKVTMPVSGGAATEGSVFNRLGGKSAVKRPASSALAGGDDDDDGGGTPTSPLEYAGVLKFPTATKKRKKIPRKNVSVTLEDSSVPAVSKSPKTSLEPKTFKVTGLSNIKPFKVQVTSTTVSPQLKKTVITSSSSSLDDMLSVAKKKSIQRAEVTTTSVSHGLLSMDAPTHNASAKTRLGKKVITAPASSTTQGFGPTTAVSSTGDIKSRLGPKPLPADPSSTSDAVSKSLATGVFKRLGKKTTS
ncbi:hypothetical protein C0Q70_13820 [Pomacea canaliculata]|uniref:SAM domain-containing protein n=1 Tax=Pomacea canaliculata TaxID=400727 RepID=A0A2T7NYB5_POMCA|nr:uncharacterized protein C19orf47-like [Pomacea canaliculata]PVD26151.1 hypothetical protein C0Q70_13820 [Pomacea canaliculata]